MGATYYDENKDIIKRSGFGKDIDCKDGINIKTLLRHLMLLIPNIDKLYDINIITNP